MDAYKSLTGGIGLVDAIHRLHHLLDGVAGEFVTEHVDTDFLARLVEGADSRFNPLNRA